MVVEHKTARKVLPANADETQLYEVIGHEPIHVDDIRSKTDMPIEQVTSTLALMELKGLVRQVGGMRYVAVREPTGEYRTENNA